ncbi:Cadherin-like protein 28 [Pteropus alecto]|uniref:Cadherin-like protein 28 n=1 Tax=Pteropus alecto TaxID=9402 RepID=L5JRB9_PTEAL|nr:Cadherin-like protein 28 [Pteropus alecto]
MELLCVQAAEAQATAAQAYALVSTTKNFRMSADGNFFSTTEFDFEAGHNSHDLIVEVRDSQGLRASTSLQVNIVNINDETPRFTSPTRVYVIPEELGPGTIVANVTAEDPDDQGFTSFLLYSITTVNSYFMINQLTGTIQVARRLDRDAGELRQNPTISLEVLVKDRPFGGQENRMQITFKVADINDNPATCSTFTFSILVPERAAKGTSLLDLNTVCFDGDSEAPYSQFNFTTPSGVGSSSRFLQDPAGSGKIVLIGDLDYENPNNIYLYVLTSPENEFPLLFDGLPYVFNVSEISPAGTRVGQVRASDKDFPQSSILYSISTGGASLRYPNIFWINPKMGELRLVTKVDYETTPIYILRIQATNGEDTSSATVTVNILDENDEKPICIPNSYFLAIPVDLKVGTNIQNFKLTCTDRDSSPRSFRYSIGPGNVNSHFTFSPNAGSNVTRLLLATPFDYTGGLDTNWDYNLLIYITDDNLLSSRKKAEALVETGTVTLSISVIPHPTTIVTTAPRPRITYQILKKNIYSPSAWYVPFVITLGSILLLGLLVSLIILLAKAIHTHCPCKTGKHKKPLVKKGAKMKSTKGEVVVLLGQNMNSTQKLEPEGGKIPYRKCHSGESLDPKELH